MQIRKVLNSSVVLVQDDGGEESILLGKGIGYGRKPGQEIDRQPSDRVFVPLSNPDAQPMIELFSAIPPEYLDLTQEIVRDAEQTLGVHLSPHIYLMLTDHLHFAVERQRKGIVVTNRVFWAIKHFYPREYAVVLLRGAGALQWKTILTNVNLLSIAVGAALYLLRIPLPAPLLETMDSMGALMGPLGMLLAGMAIAQCPLRRLACTARYYLASALRLLVYPLVVLGLLWAVRAAGWIPDGKAILMTVFLATITPACATITSMAQLYDCDVQQSSALYVLSTLLSILTMPLMLGLFDTLL